MMQADELSVPYAPDLREQVDALCAATDAAHAAAGLARLESQPALADVAQRAGNWEIRLAAAQRISDPDLLARVAAAARHRDNRVFRHCSDRLRARRRTLGHAIRAAELAAAFRGILAACSDCQALPADRFAELDAGLDSLRQECDVPQECLELAAAVRKRVQEEAQAMRDLGADAAEAEALCARIAPAERLADVEIFRAKLNEIVDRSSRRVAWLACHPTAVALAHSIERAQAALDAHPAAPKLAEPVRSTLASGESSTHAALPALPARSAQSVPSAGEREAMRELLDRLALQLEAGHLAEAEETERRLIEKANAGPLPESLLRRMRRERAQLGRMRDWARWGGDQSRERLIRTAQELLHGERDPEDLANAVTGLREEWKRLDAKQHAARKQWERFDAILTQAFRPVLEFRAERASAEKTAAAAKASLCDRCDAWAAGIDWQHADFRALAAQRHDFRARWRALPFAGFRAERRLRKRFDKPIKAVDERFGAARQTERSRREALIGEAEALREAPHLGDAIKAVVALQARWKDGGPSVDFARHDEQALWQRFRGACDALFARREAPRAARDLLRKAARDMAALRLDVARNRFELLARRSALIARLESAAAGGEGIPEALAAEVKQEWQELPTLAAKEDNAMRARLAGAAQASAAKLEQGRAERDALLLELELALDLPSPASASGARRERQLLKLQERFRRGNTEAPDPETLVLRCYATAARADPEHHSRMSAIVETLVKANRQAV